jgi:hypothetical protein
MHKIKLPNFTAQAAYHNNHLKQNYEVQKFLSPLSSRRGGRGEVLRKIFLCSASMIQRYKYGIPGPEFNVRIAIVPEHCLYWIQ